MVQLMGELIANIAKTGISVLLVEQKLTIALAISHRMYVMGHGKIVFEGAPESFEKDDSIRQGMAGGLTSSTCEPGNQLAECGQSVV